MKHDDNIIICRCEDLTLGRLRTLIAQGYSSVDEIKRISRAGMGPCQGRGCRLLIEREIAAITNTQVKDLPVTTFRQPSRPIKFSALLGGEPNEDKS